MPRIVERPVERRTGQADTREEPTERRRPVRPTEKVVQLDRPQVPSATSRVNQGLQQRRDTGTNYRKHTLFALVAAFAIQAISDPQKVIGAFFGTNK